MAPTTHIAPTLSPFNNSDLEVNRCTADNRDNFPQFGMICCVTLLAITSTANNEMGLQGLETELKYKQLMFSHF